MSGVLNSQAEALRLVAAKLESFGKDLPRSAREIIKLCSPKQSVAEVMVGVDLRYLGRADFNTREFIAKSAGHQLGDFIAKKLDYVMERDLQPGPAIRAGMVVGNGFMGCEFYTEPYRATVHVFTPGELEQLVARAIEIGRAGASR